MAEKRTEVEKIDVKTGDQFSSERENPTHVTGGDGSIDGGETEQLKEQIEETRSQMGETIGAIQEKLNYANISEQVTEHVNNAVETAKEAVYDATVGKAATIMKNLGDEISGSSLVKTAKQNPFPFILIGLGAGLLAYQSYGAKSSKTRTRFIGDGAGTQKRGANGESIGAGVTDKLSGVTDKVSDVAGDAYHKVTDAVDTAYTGASDAIDQAYGKVGELGSVVRSKYDAQIEENPLVVGAVALALGAAVGMAIPTSRTENEWLGNARKDVLDKAQNKAAELLDKTKETVTEAGRSIADQSSSAKTE